MILIKQNEKCWIIRQTKIILNSEVNVNNCGRSIYKVLDYDRIN